MARQQGYSAADYQKLIRQREREAEAARKAAEAKQKADERALKQQYIADRLAAADARTTELAQRVAELETVLAGGLTRPARLNLAGLRRHVSVPPLDLGPLAYPAPAPRWADFEPAAPSAIGRLVGQGRHERRVAEARGEFDRATQVYAQVEGERQRQIGTARRQYADRVAAAEREVAEHNRRVDAFMTGFAGRDREAVERYAGMVLAAVPLPGDFPRRYEVTFNPHAEQLVVQFELPGPAVVPTVRAVQYVQTKDADRETPRPAREIGELYRLVVSQVALLSVRDLFEADSKLTAVAFNGHVQAINPATGRQEYPCLISLNVERDTFEQLVLTDVQPAECLRYLRALVSQHPYDLEQIKPIVDFDLSKYRFIEGLDAVSTLDSRPDLMDLSPDEFEHLVRQVFEATGLEGWTTEHSRDDGVDAVMINRTPGRATLSIVQAKRYSKVVGVSHIRELAGAMEEKKAGHGILVTTSWFTTGCWQKAREHGRMELFDGPRLRALIKERLGKDVLIGIDMPRNAAKGPTGDDQAGQP